MGVIEGQNGTRTPHGSIGLYFRLIEPQGCARNVARTPHRDIGLYFRPIEPQGCVRGMLIGRLAAGEGVY